MNISKINSNQLDQIVDFMYELNNCPKHHIGYCGKNKVEIYSTVVELIEDGNQFFMVCNEDKIIGVIGYEKYDETVEIWGPFIQENNAHALNLLWDNVINSVGSDRCKYNIHCNKENQIAKEFAVDKGFKAICEGKTMSLDLSSIEVSVYDNISKLEKCDYIKLEKLHDAIFPNAYYNGKQITDMLDDEHVIFVAKEGNNLVGYVFISMNLKFNEGDIEFIGVKSNYRDKGYGKKLLSTALRAFKENGINKLQLWVNVENQNAIKIYKNVGFEIVDSLISYTMVI